MKKLSCAIIIFWLILAPVLAQKSTGFPSMKQLQSPQNPRLGFVIHGGAGVITRGSLYAGERTRI